MTRRDHILQWTVYGVALLLVLTLERFVLNEYPLFGVIPILLPHTLVACAVLEGPRAGAGFGIAVGALMATGAGGGYWRMVVCSAAGLAVGLLARYVLRHDLVGHLLCCLLVLLGRMLWCVLLRLVSGAAPLGVLLSVALPELLWSMVFAVPVFWGFRFVYRRWGSFYYQ